MADKKPAKEEKEEDVNVSLEGADPLAEGEGGKKSKKKLVIIIVVALVLLLGGGGAGLYFSGMLDKLLHKAPAGGEAAKDGKGAEKKEGGKEGEKGGKEGEAGGAQFLKIPDMIVNLNSEDGNSRYLRLSVQLEFKNAADMDAVQKVLPRVVDQFQTYLRELRVRDLRGSAGIYRLQMELLARVNQAAYPVEVQDVLFQEILIQ